jgi:hypothetical protein
VNTTVFLGYVALHVVMGIAPRQLVAPVAETSGVVVSWEEESITSRAPIVSDDIVL